MAVTYLDRFIFPLGKLRRELIYVNNVANDDTVRTTLRSVFTSSIRPVNYTGSFTNNVTTDATASGDRSIITIRDPDAVAGTVYEVEVIGQ